MRIRPCTVYGKQAHWDKIHIGLFSYVYSVIEPSLALHNKHWISWEQLGKKREPETEKLCFQLLDLAFFLILILLCLVQSQEAVRGVDDQLIYGLVSLSVPFCLSFTDQVLPLSEAQASSKPTWVFLTTRFFSQPPVKEES